MAIEGVLKIRTGHRSGETVKLVPGQECVLGRGNGCDLQIMDKGMSRVHARFQNMGDAILVTDLDSSNGCFVNGTRIKKAFLSPGDVVVVGETEILYTTADRMNSGLVVIDVEDEKEHSAPQIRKRFDDLERTGIWEPSEEAGSRLGRGHDALSSLYRLATLINAEVGLEKIFQAIADTIMEAIGPDRAFLIMNDPESGHFRPVVSRHVEGMDAGGRVSLSTTILKETVHQNVSLLSLDASHDRRFQEGMSIIQQRIRSVMCVPVSSRGEVMGAIYADTVTRPAAFREEDLALLSAIGLQAGEAIRKARLMEEIEDLFNGAVKALVMAIDAKDRYTHGHSERVMRYALAIGRELKLEAAAMRTLRFGSLFHDIGKIGIPEAVLNKPGRLTDEEYRQIMEHPSIGSRILSSISGIQRLEGVIEAVRHHHERIDGKGFPDGLAGEKIPLQARIIAVADSFDAMTSTRAYRNPLAMSVVTSELESHAGTQWDADVVAAAVNLIREGRMGPGLGEEAETRFI